MPTRPAARKTWAGKPIKYQQVADALREQITAGILPPASPLPSETEIIAQYSVSRPTARAAIAALRAEGLVTVLHGKGAFVRRSIDRPAHTHTRTVERDTDGYRDTDLDADTWQLVEEPAQYRTNATAELALAIGVPEHAPLFVYDRLLASLAQRRILHRLYLPLQTCAQVPELETDPFRTPGELYGVLASVGHALGWTETVTARIPPPDDATSLRIPDGTPMLLTRRVTRDTATGQPLAMEETRLSADDAQLAYRIGTVT